ncbi:MULTISPECIES: DUF2461 domain-containing protein [unclassified Meiothermus]|uniref:DUF2461 domain-containing protein n=1 Tax=unclassified Meiothermus TaxID=370471 RepID=UPI000D7BD819|nr:MULTISPECIES: DUF2461 domain-containing protein [unclassified Meiothermus]PZA07925.1 DUF2461 domain-containing protein [Meiothermus sp. Pnk-1]RYM36728.1 DUF2461 domain-containing protein [Meiothermus sp. PNK-Is4]
MKRTAASGSATTYFTPELFRFLLELRYNNHRAWFQANKPRYEEHVRQPFLRFIEDFAPCLKRINPAFTAEARSLFRIHRDTRFSYDKTPYKTHAAAQFRHILGRDVHAPGFYLHLEPDNCFIAGGIWLPEPEPTLRIRQAIARWDPRWMAFKQEGPPLFQEDKLKRAPKGFDPHHPLIEELKLKSFIAGVAFREEEVCSPNFLDQVGQACQRLNPLVDFLCDVLKLPTAEAIEAPRGMS